MKLETGLAISVLSPLVPLQMLSILSFRRRNAGGLSKTCACTDSKQHGALYSALLTKDCTHSAVPQNWMRHSEIAGRADLRQGSDHTDAPDAQTERKLPDNTEYTQHQHGDWLIRMSSRKQKSITAHTLARTFRIGPDAACISVVRRLLPTVQVQPSASSHEENDSIGP